MCGPSNALQNFQKHSTVDRTLQQDRLISRPSPSQGFRSSPGPNAGLLDPEFEAFQAGQLPLDHGFQHQVFSHAPPGLQQQQPGPSGWASDFQRLNISSSPPNFQQQPFSPQAQQRHDTGGWHQDFARQQGGMAERSMGQMPGQTNSPYKYSPMPGMGMTTQYAGGFAGPQAETSMAQQQQQPAEAFDEDAFARAFDEAAKSEMDSRQVSSQEQHMELEQDVMINESAERLMATSEGLLEQERIGADAIHDPLSKDPPNQEQSDPDALARTAARLLDSVRHDQSSKFQNSQFLELMRQFRDREATVEGDKIVGVNGDSEMEMGGGNDEAIKVAAQ